VIPERQQSTDEEQLCVRDEHEEVLLETESAHPAQSSEADANTESASGSVSGWKKFTFLFLAGLFFVLGLLGILLPGLPTTPFLLLTSYFLVRSSPALNNRLLRSRLFGPLLTDWQVHGGIRTGTRLKAISVVLIAVGTTVWFSERSLIPTLTVLVLAAVGITVILRLPDVN